MKQVSEYHKIARVPAEAGARCCVVGLLNRL